MHTVIIIVVSSPNADNDDDNDDVTTAIGITFALTLIIFVPCTLLIVYIVYRIGLRKAANEARVAFTGTIMAEQDSTTKYTGNDENYENLQDKLNASRYQHNPLANMQPNPAYHYQDNDEIYDKVD